MRTEGIEPVIRRAEQQDLPILLDFEQGIIRDERPFDPTIAPDPIHYYPLSELLTSEKACVLVAEIDGELVASGMARKWQARHYLDHKEYGFLGFMYTRPEFRGKGINGRITDQLVLWCKEQGLMEIRLTVYSGNNSAIRAYEKAGFRPHIVEMRIPQTESRK